MKILFSMFSELSVVSQNIYKYKWMGLKVYLKFGRGMAKFFEQFITSSQDIIIINIRHEHFALKMNSLPNLLSESACGSHKLYHIFWVTEIGGCDMAQMNLGEWAIAVHGMYESL